MALTEQLVKDTYNKLKCKANEYLIKGRIHKALLYTHLAAYTNHTFFLSFYDKELETVLKAASDKIDKSKSIGFIPKEKRCVMLDSLSRYRGGLTVQYVKAIAATGWNLLYITEQEMQAPHHRELHVFLNAFENIKVVEVPKGLNGLSKLQFIYDIIVDYAPYRLYKHLSSSDAYFSSISYALPKEIIKYNIDIADHAFLLGFQSGDYSFEFRSLGCSIASKFREMPTNRLLLLPFFPVVDDVPFKGLPDSCNGKKIVLSGGSCYKIIDKDDTFFKLIRELIHQNPDTVIIFPYSGDDTVVRQKISKYGLTSNFILLGWRDDISALYRHADVFLNTYPHGGGTMSQYAAHLHVPILSYIPEGGCANPVEGFVCQIDNTILSSIGMDNFLSEANKLLTDIDYHKKKANSAYKCVLGNDRFYLYFRQMSITCKNIISFEIDKTVSIDKKQMDKMIDYHNRTGGYQMRLVALIGINTITCNFTYLSAFVREIIPKLTRVFKQRGFHFNRI